MNDEPRYVDPDDPFEDEQTSRDKINLNGIEDLELLGMARRATGRKVDTDFQSAKEKRRWVLIDKQSKKGLIPQGWIEHCISWAKQKNKIRLIILFPALTSFILNKAKMQDWIGTQPINEVALEKYLDEDAFD